MEITQNDQLVSFIISNRSEEDIRVGVESIANGEAFSVLSVNQIIRGKIDSENKATIVLNTSLDDDTGYTIEDFSYNNSLAGKELNAKALDFLERKAVATMLITQEPRFDRYGPPNYASDENLAISMINQQLGFIVTDDKSFEIHVADNGDDSITTLKVTLEMSDIDALYLNDLITEGN
jgi:hypothetical protein